MALSNLISERIEKFGGIDLKNNYQKYFSSALGISIGIHLLIFGLYLGWTMFTRTDDSKVPHIHVSGVLDLAPPPSTTEQESIPIDAAPPPPTDIAKPSVGVPVPVPDAVATTQVMADLNKPVETGITGNGPVGGTVPTGQGTAPVHIDAPAVVEEPSKEDFVALDEDPKPVTPISSLIVYPEVAKRAGLEGKVTVSCLIGKDGHVEKVEVEKADYDVFKQPAIDAMMKARFTPPKQNGTPIRVWQTFPIVFKLK